MIIPSRASYAAEMDDTLPWPLTAKQVNKRNDEKEARETKEKTAEMKKRRRVAVGIRSDECTALLVQEEMTFFSTAATASTAAENWNQYSQ